MEDNGLMSRTFPAVVVAVLEHNKGWLAILRARRDCTRLADKGIIFPTPSFSLLFFRHLYMRDFFALECN